ncbi:MAG: FAD-dependent oxidoreductase [Planctomycetota bacterium]
MDGTLAARRFSVIGGGIAGLAAARELALRGARVTVYERGRIGERAPEGPATPASIGVLTAPRRGGSALRRLLAEAYRRYPEFVARLEEESGLAVGFETRGSLHLVPRLPAPEVRARREAVYRDVGLSPRWVDGAELEALAPGVAEAYRASLFVPEEATVDPRSLALALLASARKLGVETVEGAGEVSIADPGAPRLELPSGARVERTACVIAAGAWSGEVARRLFGSSAAADPLPVRPIRGQALEVRASRDRGPNLRFRPPGMEREYHVVPRGRGLAWVGGTVEEAGFDPSVTEAGVAELLRAARAVSPATGREDVAEAWAGLRPQALVRGGPFVGPLPGARDVWVHAGHYRSGILLAPLTARLLARAIAGEEDAIRGECWDPETLRALAVDRPGEPR